MHKRGNISILVIFVLLASSLLGILSMNFVQQMMQQSATVNAYYKSYYLAKAGIELGLTQIINRDVGFEYTVNTGDAIVSGNFLCKDNCNISLSISGTAPLLSKKFWQGSGCETSPYIISGGESIIVPLFRDITPGTVADVFSGGIIYENLADLFKNDQIQFISEFGGDVIFGMLILSGQDLSQNGMFFQAGSLQGGLSSFKDAFENYLSSVDSVLYPLESQLKNDYEKPWLVQNGFRMYLLISNKSLNPETFCVAVEQSQQLPGIRVLPTDTFFFQSVGSYGNQRVTLDASYAQPIPGFLFNTYSE